jgi:hypothetical protein
MKSCAASLTYSCVMVSMLAVAVPALAQPAPPEPDAEIAAFREELARLRQELGSLRAEVATLKREVAAATPVAVPAAYAPSPARTVASDGPSGLFASPAPSQAQPVVTPEALELLRAQVEEQAQSKVESSSRLPLRLSGTVLTNTYVNSGEANWLENPNLVAAPPPGTDNTGTMSATARQSRVGFEIGTIPIGSWQANGLLIFDFFGGVPNFQNGPVMGLPRLVYAFGRLEKGGTAIQVGQDEVLLAPRDPTSLAALSFPLLFRSGNLYLRAPQARFEQKFGSAWTVATGIVAPIAGDFVDSYEFAPAPGAGERSKRPAFDGRLAFARGDADAPSEVAVGVSGHYGWRHRPVELEHSWAAAVDANARAGRLGVAGEYYTADNAEVFGGGISQPGRASGGWIEGRFAIDPRTDVNGGFGLDRPDDAIGRVVRTRNRSVFGNVIFRLTPEVATSLEYRWLETEAGLLQVKRTNHHVNAVFAVKF